MSFVEQGETVHTFLILMSPLGVVEDVKTGRDGHVRSCVVKTKDSKEVKPITRLCLLEGSN